MWKPSQYSPEVLSAFREEQKKHPTVTTTFCHATYLINLASADRDLYERSVTCLTHNLSVSRGMGSSGLVLHVGSHLGAGFDGVLNQIADGLSRALADAEHTPTGVDDCPILIENAAGTGGTVGRSLDEIAALIDACDDDVRLGLCLDTQHLWASGINFSTVDGAQDLVESVSQAVGLERLRCLHLNDSKIELGGNRDRHANIGEGTIGPWGLAPLVGHPKVRDLPLLLEVPGVGDGPRAEDVAAARSVVTSGISLYDGDAESVEIARNATLARYIAHSEVFGGGATASVKSSPKTVSSPAKSPKSAKKTAKTAKKSTKKSTKNSTKKSVNSSEKKRSKSANKTAKKTAKKSDTKKTPKAAKSAKKTKKTAKKTAKKSDTKKTPKAAKSAKKSTKSAKKK